MLSGQLSLCTGPVLTSMKLLQMQFEESSTGVRMDHSCSACGGGASLHYQSACFLGTAR